MMKQRQKKLDTEKCDGNVYRTFYDSYESGTQILEKQNKRKKQTNKNKPKKHGQIEQHYISFLGLGLNNCIVPMPIITS